MIRLKKERFFFIALTKDVYQSYTFLFEVYPEFHISLHIGWYVIFRLIISPKQIEE